MQTPKLLLPDQYLRDATQKIREAKERVCILAMVIRGDNSTGDIVEALTDAAKRGVKVEIAADVFTYAEINGFIFPNKYLSRRSRDTNRMTKTLTKSGAKFTWLGASSMIILTGRTHSKWCIVDNTVYTFGGVNLYEEGITNTDYMFRIESKELADKLVGEYSNLTHANNHGYGYRSHTFKFGEDEVLIDSGLFADSVIYRRICRLAKQSSHVLFVSQYCPSGKLSRLLKKTNSELYFNSPKNATLTNKVWIRSNMIATGNKSKYTRDNYLHAKFIIFTLKDGSKVAVTGSHNFANSASLLGTREIVLQSRDPKIISQLEDFFVKHVA